MNTLFIITGVLIMVIGISIKQFKLYGMIAGYNTMPLKERLAFDIEKFALWLQNVFVVMGFVIIIGALINIWLDTEIIGIIIYLSAVFVCVAILIFKGQKLKNHR